MGFDWKQKTIFFTTNFFAMLRWDTMAAFAVQYEAGVLDSRLSLRNKENKSYLRNRSVP